MNKSATHKDGTFGPLNSVMGPTNVKAFTVPKIATSTSSIKISKTPATINSPLCPMSGRKSRKS